MEASYINPAFPGGAFSQPNPMVGLRAELFLYRATGNYYNWTVPPGVTYLKVTLVGGASDGTTAGSTSSFGQYATSTGASTTANGAFSVTTTRFPQNIGPSFTTIQIGNYGNSTFDGGQGIVFLQNMVPGTTIRITIGSGGGQNGVCLVEY